MIFWFVWKNQSFRSEKLLCKFVSLRPTNSINSMDVNNLFFNHAQTKSDYPIDTKTIRLIVDSFSKLNCLSAIVIDFDCHEVLYQSEEMIYLNETVEMDRKRECSNPYWTLVSDDTLNKLLEIREHYILPNTVISQEDYGHHICMIDYPITIRGHELFITQKFIPLFMREDGITRIGLFTIGYSSKREMECVIITPSGKRFQYDFEEHGFVEMGLLDFLTSAEKSVLRCSRMGMTNEEIAKSLYISVNTVKTHRSHIFKKLHVRTINEALAVVGNYNLI